MRRKKFLWGLTIGVLWSVVVFTNIAFGLTTEVSEAVRDAWFQSHTAPYRGKSLTIITTSGYGFDTALKLDAREFTRITGIKVEVTDLPWREMHDRVMANYLARSAAYDVVNMDGWQIPVLFNSGAIISLEPFLNNSELTYPDLDLGDFVKNDIKYNATWPIGKTLYALPYFSDIIMIFYNTEYFEKFGQTPPQTWDEFNEVAKNLTRDLDGDGKIEYGCALMVMKCADLPTMFHDRFSPLGGEWFDENYLPAFNNQIGLRALEMLKEHLKYAPPGSYEWHVPMVTKAFVRGDVAMAEMWTNIPAAADDPTQSTIVGKWSAAVVPKDVRYAPLYGGWSLGIPAYAKNKDLSYLFIQWATEKNMMKKVELEVGMTQARYSVLNDPDVRAKFPWYGALVDSLDVGKPSPKVPEAMEIWDTYEIYLSKFVTKELTATEALQQMYDAVYEIMEIGGYYE